MDSLLHGDERLDEMSGAKDREISLGTTMILGIFFALAVLCAVFFGFGYSLGRKSVVVTAGPAGPAAPATSVFAGFKPSSGSTLGKPDAVSAGVPAAPPVRASNSRTTLADASVVGDDENPVAAPVTRAASAVPAAALPVAMAGGSAIVQVAAVSHQEDADLLLTTLKRRGYAVAVHSEPQDKLLHVQVGPFATHKEADTMRQRLLADGFNAIVKDSK